MLTINNKNLCESCFAEINSDLCPECGFSKIGYSPDPAILKCGTILQKRYIIGKVIGKGGFGITYRAYDAKLEIILAVKEYYPYGLASRAPGQEFLTVSEKKDEDIFKLGAEKFYGEARLVAKFNGNPNIVAVHDFFYENDTAYYVMEYLDGQTLSGYVAENGSISVPRAVFIASEISNALMAAHSSNILHRDISPDNIMLCNDGGVKLLDFGAARQVMSEKSSDLSVILKQGFAPLEQYQRKGKQGPWTDIYSLGATLYYALTGNLPDDPMSRMDDDSDIEENRFGIDSEFWNILEKTLKIRYKDRYQNIFEFKNDLNAISAKPEPIITPEPAKIFVGRTAKAYNSTAEMPLTVPASQEETTSHDMPLTVPASQEVTPSHDMPLTVPASQEKTPSHDMPLTVPVSQEKTPSHDMPLTVPVSQEKTPSHDMPLTVPVSQEKTPSHDMPLTVPVLQKKTPSHDMPLTVPVLQKKTPSHDMPLTVPISQEKTPSHDMPLQNKIFSETSKSVDFTEISVADTIAEIETAKQKKRKKIATVSIVLAILIIVFTIDHISHSVKIGDKSYDIRTSKVYISSFEDKDLEKLKDFKNLKILAISGCNNLTDLSTIENLTELTKLKIYKCYNLTDISALSSLTNLTELDLYSNDISDISALSGLTNLTKLDLHSNDISDISALSGLTNLTELSLSFNEISDISVLKNLTKLEDVSISDYDSRDDIYSVEKLREYLSTYAEDSSSAEEVTTSTAAQSPEQTPPQPPEQTSVQTPPDEQKEPAPDDKPNTDSEKREPPPAAANGEESNLTSKPQKVRTNYGEYNGYSPDEGNYLSRNGWFVTELNSCVLLIDGERISYQAQFDSFGPDKYVVHVRDSDYKEIMTFEFNYGEPESGDFYDPDDPLAECCGASMRITDSVLPIKSGSASMGESYTGSDDFHPEWFSNSYIEVEYIDKEVIRWPTIVMSFSTYLNDGGEDMSVTGYLAASW